MLNTHNQPDSYRAKPCLSANHLLRDIITASALLILSCLSTIALANDDDELQRLEVTSLYVDLMKDMPSTAKLINSPYPQSYTTYGAKSSIDTKSVIKGGRALRVRVKRTGKSYDQGSYLKTIGDINQGDTLCLTFWARSINKPELNITSEFASLGVQQSAEPYRNLLEVSQSITAEWAMYSFKAEARETLKTGDAQIFMHYGHLKQRFEIGPTYLFNLGASVPENYKSNACGK